MNGNEPDARLLQVSPLCLEAAIQGASYWLPGYQDEKIYYED